MPRPCHEEDEDDRPESLQPPSFVGRNHRKERNKGQPAGNKRQETPTSNAAGKQNTPAAVSAVVTGPPKQTKQQKHRAARMRRSRLSENDPSDDSSSVYEKEDFPGAVQVGGNRNRDSTGADSLQQMSISNSEASLLRNSSNPMVIEANLVEEGGDDDQVQEKIEDGVNDYIERRTVAATQVEVEDDKQRLRRRLFVIFFIIVLSATAVGLGVIPGEDSTTSSLVTAAPTTTVVPTSSAAPTTTIAPSGMPSTIPTETPSETPTGTPTVSKFEFLYQTIGPDITDDLLVLRDTSTVQYLSLAWLADNDRGLIDDLLLDPQLVDTHQMLVERYAIRLLYGTVGSTIAISDDFVGLLDTCFWNASGKGVFCNSDGTFVDEVVLSFNSLQGQIPTEVGLLTNLRNVDVAANELTGTIPTQVGQLTKLQQFSMSTNPLTGAIPSEAGLLTNLSRFRLRNTLISGEVPSELGQLSLLTQVILCGNNLSGDLDPIFCATTDERPTISDFRADCSEVTCTCCTFCHSGQGQCLG